MTDMADEEYDELDERWTKTTPRVNFNRPGVFAQQRALLDVLDKVTVGYILARAEASGQTPAQVIEEIVHQEIEVSVSRSS
ncbi:MAG: hypothetical protein FWG77_06445 [Treponema sp.]|nr:hypothetical protein [Treponema sp.]